MNQLMTLDVKMSEKITIGEFPLTGRGLKAIAPIYKGATIMEIGRPSLVSARFVFENYQNICGFVSCCYPTVKIDVFDLVVLWLLTEKNNHHSKFQEMGD